MSNDVTAVDKSRWTVETYIGSFLIRDRERRAERLKVGAKEEIFNPMVLFAIVEAGRDQEVLAQNGCFLF